MARSDLLKQLLAAYSRADDATFRSAAARIIEGERRKGHNLLAADLEHALTRDHRSATDSPLTMRPLPKGRDERPLLALSKPSKELDDLVLSTATDELLRELIEENRNRSLLAAYRLVPRQRMLFIGPSGTGKSASANALANELSLPVATVSLAALTSSYLGETARNIESIIQFGEQTPCVLLFDEFDAIGTERGDGSDHAELRRVVATVLQLIESMSGESLVVATSNHPHSLDRALWRRFDEVVEFGGLNLKQTSLLLRLRLRGVPNDVSAEHFARRLQILSPADIEAVCLDAQRRWVLSRRDVLSTEIFEMSVRSREKRTTSERVQTPRHD